MLLTSVACGAIVLGVFSHLGYFIHGEHHIQAPLVLRTYSLFLVFGFCIELFGQNGHLYEAQITTCFISGAYGIGLFGSMLSYRAFFHSLRAFPGPFMARTSKLWNVLRIVRSTNFALMEEMHDTYGDFVRTGKYIASSQCTASWKLLCLGPST